MKGNSFVPPKVTTPQQYFIMNAPQVEAITLQTNHNIQNNNQNIPYSNPTNISHAVQEKVPVPPSNQFTAPAIHQPALDKIKNFMQPSAHNKNLENQTSRITTTPEPIFSQINHQTPQPVSPLETQPKPLLKNGSMRQSAITECASNSKKLTFTENLVQQIPVESWKKQNLQNTFGYIPPPQEEQKNNLQKEPTSEGLMQKEIQSKQLRDPKKKTQPCCLLF